MAFVRSLLFAAIFYPATLLCVLTGIVASLLGRRPTLAVVLNALGLSTEQMQSIAAEFNLAETTFVLPPKDSDPNIVWKGPKEEPNPYQLEWDHLMAAIRSDRPYNEAERGALASAVTSMGRQACHTGQAVTLEQFLQGKHEFAITPGIGPDDNGMTNGHAA